MCVDGLHACCPGRPGLATAARFERWARQGKQLMPCAACCLPHGPLFVVVRTFDAVGTGCQLEDVHAVGRSRAGSVSGFRVDRPAALNAREVLRVCMRACDPSCYRDASGGRGALTVSGSVRGSTLDLGTHLRLVGDVELHTFQLL